MAATLHPFPEDQSAYSRTITPIVDDNIRYPSSKISPSLARSLQVESTDQSGQKFQRTSLSYALPTAATRRVFERYSLAEAGGGGSPGLDISHNHTLSTTPRETQPAFFDLNDGVPHPTQVNIARVVHQHHVNTQEGIPRHLTMQSAVLPSVEPLSAGNLSPIMPLSASAAYAPPVAPRHRAYPQQPTYIIPPATPNPIDTVLPIPRPQQEEVCVECSMRDHEMADVDVTSPGVWERESDIFYEELKQREIEEEASGGLGTDPSRPRARGGRLTEQNLKLWQALNPREPASKQQSLNAYIKAQRALLEAEALAQAQAMQEVKQFDSKMRETYSQLRQSTYDLTNAAVGVDDTGGLRIRQPTSPIPGALSSRHARSHSREVKLLENGMVVEHVDVRKEEREERERRKREEKRARKLSRSSALDKTSIISATSVGQLTDNGLGLQPYSSYSQSNSRRPNSVLTAPSDRPDVPPAYSQASFSDVHSVGSNSPRRSRFLGFRSLTPGWKSRDSLSPSGISGISGISGSMIDMHLALHHEPNEISVRPIELHMPPSGQVWSKAELEGAVDSRKPEKKKNGLARIWRLVTGAGKGTTPESREVLHSTERLEDDFPLAPPPPLSYLVDRSNGDMPVTNGRHSSTPSLPSIASIRLGGNPASTSPPTPPSSALPSPVSSRPYGGDVDNIEVKINYGGNSDDQEMQRHDESHGKNKPFGLRKVHLTTSSEPDIRVQVDNGPLPPVPHLPTSMQNKPSPLLLREKSLPPLPNEPACPPSPTPVVEARPRTIYSDDPRSVRLGFLPLAAPNYDARRQSFGGTTSRPNMRSMPMKSQDPQRSFGLRYDEFGVSRRSLGRLEFLRKSPAQTSGKTKSSFLSTLLGKKQSRDLRVPHGTTSDPFQQFPSMRRSGSDSQDDPGMNGYATSASRHSVLSMGGPSRPHRISTMSRKALEELVPQDPEFVAYRYPSKEQRVEFLRQHPK